MPSKAQTGKSKHKSSVQPTPSPTQEPEDVVPRCFNHAQYMNMLMQEEADETVAEIVDELTSKVVESCLKVHIEKQLIPFTVSWAKNYLIRAVEQRIIFPDEGEDPEESSKTEDSEPLPTICDAWAQGCVPVVSASPHSHTIAAQLKDERPVQAQTEPRVSQQCDDMPCTSSAAKQPAKETRPRRSVTDTQSKVHSPRPPPKTDQKKRQKVNLSPKPIQGKSPPVPSSSAVEVKDKSSLLFANKKMTGQINRPKDHRPIPRLNPSSLPQHCIVPQYEIVNNDDTNAKPKKPFGLSKLEPQYNKKHAEQTVVAQAPLTGSMGHLVKSKMRDDANASLKKPSLSKRTLEGTFNASLKLDTMVLAKGVSRGDSQKDERDPLRFNSLHQSNKLKPIKSDIAKPLLSVDQLTAGQTPQVTPQFQTENR